MKEQLIRIRKLLKWWNTTEREERHNQCESIYYDLTNKEVDQLQDVLQALTGITDD